MPTKPAASKTKQRRERSKSQATVAARRESESSKRHARIDLAELRRRLGVPRRVLARLSGYSERALAAWEAGKPLSGASQQRLAEVHRLGAALARVMQPDFVRLWLQSPNDQFEGLKPLEVIERGEVDRLWLMIYLLESGQPG